jgi:hypothetical protein
VEYYGQEERDSIFNIVNNVFKRDYGLLAVPQETQPEDDYDSDDSLVIHRQEKTIQNSSQLNELERYVNNVTYINLETTCSYWETNEYTAEHILGWWKQHQNEYPT